jgi:hypothetical protein
LPENSTQRRRDAKTQKCKNGDEEGIHREAGRRGGEKEEREILFLVE